MEIVDFLAQATPRDVAGVLATFVGLVVALGLLWAGLLGLVLYRMTAGRDAGQLAALRAAPLQLVLLLDAIDLGLDVLGAPLVWLVMSRSELRALRGLSVIETLIPGTQLLPAMTISWLYARTRRAGGPGLALRR